jgi:hypothetical protein
VNAATRIKHCKFIRVVSRSRANKLGHERGLAAEAMAGNHDGLSSPAHDSRVNEHAAMGVKRNPVVQIRLEVFEDVIEIERTIYPASVEIKDIESAHPGSRPFAADTYGIQSINNG